MSETAMDRVLAALVAHGCKVSNAGTAATCPAHEDRAPSLSIGRRADGTGVLLKCHSGCSIDDITAALNLAPRDLFDAPAEPSQRPQVVAEYNYTDEHGQLLYQKLRYVPKTFRQRRPQGSGWDWRLGNTRRVLYRLPEVSEAVAAGETVYLAEGEKDADQLAAVGVCATTWSDGAWKPGQSSKWRPEYSETLRGAHVVICRDRDEAGRNTAADIAAQLEKVAASVRVVQPAEGKDAFDHLAAGRGVEEFVTVPGEEARPPAAEPSPGETITLEACHETFRRWLGQDYDLDALDVTLAAAAVEKMGGDPLWLLLVSGSGNAKTETVQALSGAGALLCSTITSEGALLSATSKKEVSSDATGGLLRQIGSRGVLVIKDVTSVLSMNRDLRGQVLGALREVYDGRWTRNVGTDGGRALHWEGRLVVLGAVTTAWDTAHSVIASMGDRFVLLRMDSTTGRQAAGRRAIGNTGHEVQMRAELSEAAGGVLRGVAEGVEVEVTEEVTDILLTAADLVTLARTGVEYDSRGDVVDAHAPEMPTRFAKQLAQVVRGGVAIGMDYPDAVRLAVRCARDSMPPLRLAIVDYLAEHPDSSTAEVRKALGKPRATVDRQLQALQMLGVLECDEEETEWAGRPATRWHYRLADGIDPSALQLDPERLRTKSVPKKSVPTPIPLRERGREEGTLYPPSDKSGTDSLHTPPDKSGTDPTTCAACGEPMIPLGDGASTHPTCGSEEDR